MVDRVKKHPQCSHFTTVMMRQISDGITTNRIMLMGGGIFRNGPTVQDIHMSPMILARIIQHILFGKLCLCFLLSSSPNRQINNAELRSLLIASKDLSFHEEFYLEFKSQVL